MLNLVTHAERIAYTEAKHYQGKLCRRNHDHGGFSWRHKGHDNCVDCCRLGARLWRERYPERAAQNTARRDNVRIRTGRNKIWPIATLVGSARNRAKLKGLPFDISADHMKEQWIKQRGLCYWAKTPLSFEITGARHPLRPSLDRLEPSRGYTKGNVVWASNFMNRARGECDAAEFGQILESLISAYISARAGQ